MAELPLTAAPGAACLPGPAGKEPGLCGMQATGTRAGPVGGPRQILTRRQRSIIHHLKVCEILWFLGSFCSSKLLRVHLFWGGFSTYHDSACYIRQILGKGYHFIVVIIICAFELVRKNPVHSTFSLYMNTWIALHINCFPAPHIFRKPL